MDDPTPPPRPLLPTHRHPRRLLAAGLAAGLLGNAWLVDVPLGLGFFVLSLSWVLALRTLGGRESWERAGATRWLLLPLVVCAGFVGLRDAPTLTALNVLTVGLLACLSVQLFPGERAISSLGLRGYLGTAFTGAVRGIFAGPVVAVEAVDLEGAGAALRTWGKPALRAAALVIPILVVFGALLASADEVFSAIISSRIDSLANGSLTQALSSAAVVCGLGLASSGMWAIALRRRDRASAGPVINAERRAHRGAFEAFAVIGSLLVLFAGFTAIQATCLFGQAALPHQVTWSDYARQGFFQLLVVAGLTVALITGLSRAICLPQRLTRPFAAACSALVALTLVILASAVKRLTLYEEAYGFTELRVYAHVFSFALGAMLLWRAVSLWRWTQSFATGAVVSLLGFVLSLDVLNPDALIATRNLERQGHSGAVDVQYLTELSADASPVLFDKLSQLGGDQAWALHLRGNPRQAGGWPSANLSRWRALGLSETLVPRNRN